MINYYIRITNDEAPAPLYVERGAGFSGVLLTADINAARRYSTREEAEKIAALARKQRDKESGGESSAVEIIEEGAQEQPGEWSDRFEFRQCSTGARSVLQMRKAPEGIKTRYITINGSVSEERGKSDMDDAVIAWTDSLRAWLIHKIHEGDKR